MRRPALALALALTLSGCGGRGRNADTTLQVKMTDYTFVGVPATVRGPKVRFEAETTQGEHELVVLRGDREIGHAHPPPRGKADLAVELAPGDYVLVCRIKEGPKSHEELGMRQPFSVR